MRRLLTPQLCACGGSLALRHDPQVLFAIYDGHGGQGCVTALASSLHQHLARQPSFFGDPTSALALAFAEMDAVIVRTQAAKRAACYSSSSAHQPEIDEQQSVRQGDGSYADGQRALKSAFSSHINVDQRIAIDSSGAVAVVALVRLENPTTADAFDTVNVASWASGAAVGGSHPALHAGAAAPLTRVYLAHVGDARAVLSRRGVAIDLTRDHRAASRPDEVARVMAAGGWVRGNRVMGVLGVTRSFGDAELKGSESSSAGGGEGASSAAGGLAQPQQSIVVAEPDVRVVDVGPLE